MAKKINHGLEDHNGKIFWKVIHSNAMNHTSVILYVNAPAGYFPREYKIQTNIAQSKGKKLKEAIASEKAHITEGMMSMNDLNKSLHENSGLEKPPHHASEAKTLIHIQFYKPEKDQAIEVPPNLFYNRYLFSGSNHAISIKVDSPLDDSALDEYFLDISNQ
jgi:hypothetical protein